MTVSNLSGKEKKNWFSLLLFPEFSISKKSGWKLKEVVKVICILEGLSNYLFYIYINKRVPVIVFVIVREINNPDKMW